MTPKASAGRLSSLNASRSSAESPSAAARYHRHIAALGDVESTARNRLAARRSPAVSPSSNAVPGPCSGQARTTNRERGLVRRPRSLGECVLNPEQAAVVEEVVSQPVPRLPGYRARRERSPPRPRRISRRSLRAGNRGPSIDESCARSLAESRSRWRQADTAPRRVTIVNPLYSSIAPEAREREG